MIFARPDGLLATIGRAFSTKSVAAAGMNVHLLGAGSTGCLLAYHLQKSIERSENADRRKDRITLQLRRPPSNGQPDGESVDRVRLSVLDAKQQERREASFSWESSAQHRSDSIDVLIVTTKADQTIKALEPLIPRLASPDRKTPATLVIVQNGVGLDDELVHAFAWKHASWKPFMLLGINSNGTWTKGRFETVHAAQSDIKFGLSPWTEAQIGQGLAERLMAGRSLQEDSQPSTETLSGILTLLQSPYAVKSIGASCLTSSKDFSVHQQRKLVSNCALNPLAALYNVRNGELQTNAEAREKVVRIVDECAHVLQARFHDVHGHGASLPDGLTSSELHRYVWTLIEITRENWCSMVQDMWSGRGSTEIAFLNGTIVRWAEQLGLSAPLNAEMVDKISEKASEVAGQRKAN